MTADAREVLVCVNRSSGSAERSDKEAEQIRDAFAATGLEVRVELVAGGGISEHAKKAVDEGTDLLVVGGGDGSISGAAGILAGTKTRLGILPLGSSIISPAISEFRRISPKRQS